MFLRYDIVNTFQLLIEAFVLFLHFHSEKKKYEKNGRRSYIYGMAAKTEHIYFYWIRFMRKSYDAKTEKQRDGNAKVIQMEFVMSVNEK